MTLTASAALMAQDVQAIAERIDRQRYDFPQEKIHMMTDRGSYLAGDTIWLRTWVVDAATHTPVDASKFVYVELVSPTDSVFKRVKIHQDAGGRFTGYMPLDLDLPEGRYQLTAYTMFMQSAGVEYFYSQPVEVAALSSLKRRIVSRCVRYNNEVDVTLRYENLADNSLCPFKTFGYESSDKSWNERQYNGRIKEEHITLKGKDAKMPCLMVEFDNYAKYIALPPEEALDVSFYPEGGYLVPNQENTVTFKVHNTGTQISGGDLLDQDGHVVSTLTVEHDGMGMVTFTPAAGGVYKARWKDNFDQDVTFDLPRVRDDATIVQARHGDDGLVTARAAGARARGALVVMQQRGRLLAAGYDSLAVRSADLPAGVVQVLLLDDEMRCLSERLLFANSNSTVNPNVTTDKDSYTDRQLITVNVDLKSLPCRQGDYAVSVIDAQATDVAEGNILANLLLQSDLKGRINNPGY